MGRYKISKHDPSLKTSKRRMKSKKKRISTGSRHSQIKSKAETKSTNDLSKCFSILKDICIEINVLNDEDDTDSKLNALSDEFFSSLPKSLKASQVLIKDNETIKEYMSILNGLNDNKTSEF
jgi:hypothetical protein